MLAAPANVLFGSALVNPERSAPATFVHGDRTSFAARTRWSASDTRTTNGVTPSNRLRSIGVSMADNIAFSLAIIYPFDPLRDALARVHTERGTTETSEVLAGSLWARDPLESARDSRFPERAGSEHRLPGVRHFQRRHARGFRSFRR